VKRTNACSYKKTFLIVYYDLKKALALFWETKVVFHEVGVPYLLHLLFSFFFLIVKYAILGALSLSLSLLLLLSVLWPAEAKGWFSSPFL